MTAWLKKLSIGFGLLIFLLGIFIFGALGSLKIGLVQQFVIQKVNDLIPGEIRFETFRMALFRGEIELESVILKGAEDEQIILAERLFVDLAWSALLKGDLTIMAAAIEGPKVALESDEQGKFNVVQAFISSNDVEAGPEEEPEVEPGRLFPFNIVVKDFSLTKGTVRYEMASADLIADLREIDLQADLDLGKISGNISLQVGKGSLAVSSIKTELERFGSSAKLVKGHADLDIETGMAAGSFKFKGEAELKEAFLKGLLYSRRNLEALSYKGNIQVERLALESLFTQETGLTGLLGADLSAAGKGIDQKSISARTKLALSVDELSKNKAASSVDLDLKMEASVEQGLAKINKLEASSKDLHLTTNGQYNVSSGELLASLVLAAPDVAAVLSFLGLQDAGGSVDLKVDVAGRAKQPVLSLALQGERLRYQQITLGQVRIEASIDESGRLSLSRFTLENQGSVFQGTGSMHVFEESLKPDTSCPLIFSGILQNGEIKDFLGYETAAAGTFTGELALKGETRALEGELSFSGKALQAKSVRIGDVSVSARLSQGKVHLDKMAIRNKHSLLRASGNCRIFQEKSLAFINNPAFQIKLDAGKLFLEDFLEDYKGKIKFSSRLKGKVKQPLGTVKLVGEDLDLGLQKADKLELSAELDGQGISIDPFRIVVASEEYIEGTGRISLEKEYKVKLASSGISLKSIDKIKEAKLAEGMVAFQLSGAGTFEDPNLKGDLVVSNLSAYGKPLDDFNVHLDLREQAARISGNLNFDFFGTYHLKKKDFSASLEFDETVLAPYFVLADQADLHGTLTGKVEAFGNIEAIDKISGAAKFSKLDLFVKDRKLAQSRDSLVTYKNGELSIPSLKLTLLETGKMAVKGKGRYKGPVDFELEGIIPLEILNLFMEDDTDAKGDLRIAADISGDFLKPDIYGDVEFKEAGMTIPELMQTLHALNGRIRLDPEKIILDGIRGSLETGRFSLDGTVEMEAFKPVKTLLAFSAKALPVRIPEVLDMLINMDVKIEGTEKKSLARGELTILEGLYYKDVNLSLLQFIPEKKREVAPLPKDIPYPVIKNMDIDLSIKGREPFLIENNLAGLAVRTDLHVSGKMNKPILSGQAKVESGTIHYQKKDFDVKRGVIDFINPYKIEPTLDIKSEVLVRNWVISLEVSGPPDQLQFLFSSDPSEEDQDILSLLMIGKTTRELIEGEGGASRSTEQMLAEMISSTFGEDIKKRSGLDVLEVETQEAGGESSADRIKVTVGKNLSKRMTMKYSMESKNGEVLQRTSSEYKLLENILLSGFQDTKGSFGGELMYRLEFR